MLQLLILLTVTMVAQPPGDFAPASLPREQLPTGRALTYEFNEVQISTILGWLRRVGVQPPVVLNGEVSGWLWAQAPSGSWWRLTNYRVEGELTSPLLDIDEFSIRSARIRFGYRDSLWTVGTAAGQIESLQSGQQRTPLGQAELAATLPMSAAENVQVSGRLDHVSLVNLLTMLGLTDNAPSGIARGTFQLSTPLGSLAEPLRWQASGSIVGSDIRFGQIAGVNLASQWQLADRTLSLTQTEVTLGQQRLVLAGQLSLHDAYAWSVSLPTQAVQLSSSLYENLSLTEVEPIYLPLGSVNLVASAQGTLSPWQAAYGIGLDRGEVLLLDNQFRNFRTQLRLFPGGLMLDSFSANVTGGAIEAQAAFTTQADEPLTLQINYQQLDLAQLRIPDNILGDQPAAMRGVITGQAQLTAPKQNLNDVSALAIEVSGSGTEVGIADWGLGNIQYTLNKASGSDEMTVVLNSLAAGAITAQAAFSTQLNAPVSLQIDYQQLDLAQLQFPDNLFSEEQRRSLRGVVSGQARFSAPTRNLDDMAALATALSIEVSGSGAGVWIADWGLGNIEYTLNKASGSDEMALDVKDAGLTKRWQAAGELAFQADGSWRYAIDARGNQLDLAIPELMELIGIENEIPIDLQYLLVTGNIKMLGNSSDGLQSTVFNLSNITTLRRDRAVWSQGNMQGFNTPEVLVIERSELTVGGSDIVAAITWYHRQRTQDAQPVTQPQTQQTLERSAEELRQAVPQAAAQAPGQDRVALSVRGLTLETFASWNLVPADYRWVDNLRGHITAEIDLQRPAHGQSPLWADWRGTLAVGLQEITASGQGLGDFALKGQLSEDRWQAQVSGELLEATVDGSVDVGLGHDPEWGIRDVQANLTWLSAEIGRLTALWQDPDKARYWTGLANVRMQLVWQQNGLQSGTAEVEVPRLAYRQRAIVRDLLGQVVLEGQRLRLARLRGGLGGGRVEVSGGYDLSQQRFDSLSINLNRIDLSETAQLIEPDLASVISGRADARGTIQLNGGFAMAGAVRLSNVNWIGIPVAQAHSEVTVTTTAGSALTRIHASNIRGRAFGGRLTAELEARLSRSRSFQARVRIDRGEVEQLSRWSGTASVVGRGKFDGTLVVGTPRFSSARDLQGSLDIQFDETNARTLPAADQLARFVPLFGLGSTEFERGRLLGTISRGDLRMRSLALWGPQLSVLGSGNIGLLSSRLDLQLVVRVGGGLSQQIAASYLTQLAAASVPPVQLALQINRLVSNRAIFLRVAGTTAQPIIQPQTARIIEQILVRSLLEQAVGL